ncbi:type VII secretion target [Salinifilum ghardaiensis]
MGFKANHKSIQQFGEELSGLVGDSREAESYAEKWLSFGYSEGRMFITAVEAAENAKQALVENYQRLVEVQRSAASEVDKAAHSYEQMDRGEAARLDNSYKKKSN